MSETSLVVWLQFTDRLYIRMTLKIVRLDKPKYAYSKTYHLLSFLEIYR